jgi:hypothetical protein
MSGACTTENNTTIIPSDDVLIEPIASKPSIASIPVTNAIEKHSEALKKAGIEEVLVTTSQKALDDPTKYEKGLRIEYKDTNGNYDRKAANDVMQKIVATLKEAGVDGQVTATENCVASPLAITAPLTPNTIVPFSDRVR